ncbi:hypothetical protein [Luethyella okanaganae]|uniref:Uncharacterized protein n=1 Tax=Luethyella okanaganae TaxID=69372 RepID=A0ABW1VGT5_9MICO
MNLIVWNLVSIGGSIAAAGVIAGVTVFVVGRYRRGRLAPASGQND